MKNKNPEEQSKSQKLFEVNGTVDRPSSSATYCFVIPLDKLPDGFQLERGKGLFMHISTAGGQLPERGARGRFEVGEGRKGPEVKRVVRWDHPAANKESRSSTGTTFVHPYNFVSLPADGLGKEGSLVSPFGRTAPAPHDRYLATHFSGWIDCKLETKSNWFIPDTRKQLPLANGHKFLGYFTLDKVKVNGWNKDHPELDKTRPAIPASSLRGMVRSVFEAVTLSCMPVFDKGILDFRISSDPGFVSTNDQIPTDRGRPSYMPARVVSKSQAGLEIQILDGRTPSDDQKTLRVALVQAYSPNVKARNASETVVWRKCTSMPDGTPVAALIDSTVRKKERNGSPAYFYREVHDIATAANASKLNSSPGKIIIFGYLHRTGPNIESKHHERVFFRWGDYNPLSESKLSLEDRFKRFQADTEKTVIVDRRILREAEASLLGYHDRHSDEARRVGEPPRSLSGGAPVPSDFISSGRPQGIQIGDLFYALMEGDTKVHGLYPVAMPRLTHENSRGDLLHNDFHTCENPEELCAACRVFGWVRPSRGTLTPKAGQVDAVAGHVRFTHGLLQSSWGTEDQGARLTTLAILGSPKPTTTAFYLEPRQPQADFDKARLQRWPPSLQTAMHNNIPLYRSEEASLRGRKFYRHRKQMNLNNPDPLHGGIVRPTKDKQNQTVHLLPPNLTFSFRVNFDNLTEEELGSLLFALTLTLPESWGKHSLSHLLGHGKPLGLGTSKITFEKIHVDSFKSNEPSHRFAIAPNFTSEPGAPVQEYHQLIENCLRKFETAWKNVEWHNPNLEYTRLDVVEMLRTDSPDAPIHYPPAPDGEEAKNFKWFVQNKKKDGNGILLPEATCERDTPKDRLT